MREGAAGLSAILDVEMDLHVKLCAGLGFVGPPISSKRLQPAEMLGLYALCARRPACAEILLALKVALAPCVIGYAEIANAARHATGCSRRTTNPYSRVDRRIRPVRHNQEVAAKKRAGSPWNRLADLYVTPARESRADRNLQGSHPSGKPTFGIWDGGRSETNAVGVWPPLISSPSIARVSASLSWVPCSLASFLRFVPHGRPSGPASFVEVLAHNLCRRWAR